MARRSNSLRAVVTGGAGFVGSHVIDALLERSYEVLVVDDLSTGDVDNLPAAARLAEVDICDREALDRAVDGFGPTLVCHLAAQPSVAVSMREPGRDLVVNVHGTLNVCEAARRARAPLVFASTGGALYGDDAELPADESTPAHPLSPYGASKLAGEAYVATWARLHGLPNVILRLANVYGPRQTPHGEAGVVAIFSDRLARGDRPTVNGDGEQTRDFVYVLDVARAFVLAAENGEEGTFNVGTGVETSVNELLRRLQEIAGTAVEPRFGPPKPGELRRSVLNAGRIGEVLGWRPEMPLEQGIAETFRPYVQS